MSNNSPIILNGLVARNALSEALISRVRTLTKTPTLVIISIGSDPASEVYVNNKKKFGTSIDCTVRVLVFPENCAEREIIEQIQLLNGDTEVNGIIVQSPVPKNLHFENLISHVSPQKDVDGLTRASLFVPATAKGIFSLLHFYNIDLVGKYAVVIGRSRLVGMPTAQEFIKRDLTVTICHSKTKDLIRYTKMADIIVVATGVPRLLTGEHVSEGQVIIDVGIHKTKDGFEGDVAYDEVAGKVKAISPVPGGVGPMTVLSLFENLVLATEKQNL